MNQTLKTITAIAFFALCMSFSAKAQTQAGPAGPYPQWLDSGPIYNNPLDANVGIGTTTPTFGRLEVQTTSAVNNTPDNIVAFCVKKQTSASFTRRMYMVPHLTDWGTNHLSRDGDMGLFWTDGRQGTSQQNSTAGLVIAPWAYSSAGIRITSLGNVGIGTALTSNTQGYKLAVNGTIGAKAIKVEITSDAWADYVFEKAYKLIPLAEVEKFIKINKHLPEIPSASEIEKNGLDVGVLMKLQMQKIEELTLYIIQQGKELDKLRNELDAVKK